MTAIYLSASFMFFCLGIWALTKGLFHLSESSYLDEATRAAVIHRKMQELRATAIADAMKTVNNPQPPGPPVPPPFRGSKKLNTNLISFTKRPLK